MTTYSQGQVVLLLFPFTDLTATKQRPAVILSSDSYNQSHQDVILAGIYKRRKSHVADKNRTSIYRKRP
ncbi:MAG: type II toxin-antitoxin system PemK/MazF family toxin [Nitrospirae bacterium]|nr:type II toxin-antitoxin system PemK/MazF family toxin [Nitrospirota bacterium]